jgi:iron-sulfur cluster assembly protein
MNELKNFKMVETQTLNNITNSPTLETQNPLSGGRGALENSIYISDKAKQKVLNLMQESGVADHDTYFLRVGVVGGGCSGLSYKMDFDNEVKPMDQVFEDKGIKIVCDLKSFLYLVNTELEFSDGLNGKGFYFDNPNASRSCGCGESFAV